MDPLSPNCFNLQAGAAPYPPAFVRGIYSGNHQLRARLRYPGPRARRKIGGPSVPYWHVINFTLAARDTDDDQVVPEGDTWVCAIMATTGVAVPTGATAQIELAQVEGEAGFRLNSTGVNVGSLAGTAQNPFYLLRPYLAGNRQPIMGRARNAIAGANNVQLVLFGLRSRAAVLSVAK